MPQNAKTLLFLAFVENSVFLCSINSLKQNNSMENIFLSFGQMFAPENTEVATQCPLCGIYHTRKASTFCSDECEEEAELERQEREIEKSDILDQLNHDYEN